MASSAPEADIHAPIEAENDDYDDADSAIASDIASSTTSIGSSILSYRKENGRTYHAYKEGKYNWPNDEAENDRLDLQHHLFALTFQNKLFHAPAPEGSLHRVLDLGTGTGIWAIDFADEHPESQVLGVDLSPIQPSFLPPNLQFEIDDIEDSWTYSSKFDLIHGRMLVGSIQDWPKLINTIFENLNPGGWAQLSDGLVRLRTDDDTIPADSKVKKWCDLLQDGAAKFGRGGDSPLLYKEQFTAAGFEEVTELVYKWPINRWPKDARLKEIGMWNQENVGGNLSGLSMALFTRALGWHPDELEVFLAEVRNEMKNTKIHAYFPVYVVYGKKPAAKSEEKK